MALDKFDIEEFYDDLEIMKEDLGEVIFGDLVEWVDELSRQEKPPDKTQIDRLREYFRLGGLEVIFRDFVQKDFKELAQVLRDVE